jgi:predicted ATPase
VSTETSPRDRLTKLELDGFKTFRELVFEARGLNVLIGANGVGKSNFTSFFRLMSRATASSGSLQREIAREGGASRLLHDGPPVTRDIVASLVFQIEAGTVKYSFELEYAAADTLIIRSDRLDFEPSAGGSAWQQAGPANFREPTLDFWARHLPHAQRVLDVLRRCTPFQFHDTSPTSRMRSKWGKNDNRYLKEDGANLAPVLLRLQKDEPLAYRRIVDTLRLIVPFLDDFELNPDHDALLLAWREMGSDVVFDASQASDGMLRTMALVTLLAQPEGDLPSILILDEPELGLHPYGISVVGAMIKRASKYVQVIVATQSVTLVDQFTPEDIVVVERPMRPPSGAPKGGGGRESTMRRLESEPLATWLTEYSLGELWLKNLLGARPSR